MARGYRAILELQEKEDVWEVAYRIFHEWINGKYRSPDGKGSIDFEQDGIYQLGKLTVKEHPDRSDDVIVTRLHESCKDDHYIRHLLEVVNISEENERWTTRVYAMTATKESRYRKVIWIEVIPPASFEGPARRPNLVVNLVSQYEVRESGVLISDSIREVIDQKEVDVLVDQIFDQQRRVAIVVAAPISDENDHAHHKWGEILKTLTDDSCGCASYFLLKPDVYDYFCQRIGSLKMGRGCLRTYLPQVNPSDDLDSKRHRILTSSTLYHGIDSETRKFRRKLSEIIAQTPCTYLWEKGLDGELKSAEDVLSKQRIHVPTFPSSPVVEVLPDEPHDQELSLTGGLANSVQEALAKKKPQRFLEGPSTQVLQTRATSTVRTRPIGGREVPWANPLIALIRRFAPLFNPKTHEDLKDGVEALSDGIKGIDKKYDELKASIRTLKLDHLEEKKRLQIAQETGEALLQQVREELSEQIRQVEQEKDRFEDQEIERSYERDEMRKLEAENRKLQWQVSHPQLSPHDFVDTEQYLDEPPEDMATLFDWMTADDRYARVREYVEFSAPKRMQDAIMELDEKAENWRYAADFWKFILVLRDYMRACEVGDFCGSVHQYLKESVGTYRTCSYKRHAPTESQTVRNTPGWRTERIFPIPFEVNPEGEVEMFAHFKTSHSDTNDPRMYYLIDNDHTHKVYIGYIGPHLTNTKTN
jgi:hypothetical protein